VIIKTTSECLFIDSHLKFTHFGETCQQGVQLTNQGPLLSFPNSVKIQLAGQKNLYRKEITELVIETSKVELNIVYPILYFEVIKKGRNKGKQKVRQHYQPLKNQHIFRVESGGNRYTVTFDSLLGKLFCHNIQLKGFNQLPDNFYDLPKPAQLVYRRFLSHIYKAHPIKLHIETITSFLNLEIKDGSMMKHNIQKNILEPLKNNELPLISSYEYHDLFNERFYNIKI
jgi:hypothetical protein